MFKSFASASLAAIALAVGDHSQLSADLELAEVVGGHTCLSSAKRGKEAVDDFWTLLKGTAKYTDDDFTADASSVYWAEMGEATMELATNGEQHIFKRAS